MVIKTLSRMLGLMILGSALLALDLPAQDPAPSVAEAARRSREQKKKAAKPATVITDDTLHPSGSAPATSDQERAKPADSSGPESATNQDSKQTDATAADKEKKRKAEIDALKQRIAEQKETVKLTQREIVLQQDTFYSNPDYGHDTAGKEKLEALKAELQQKQGVLADLQSKLAALGGTEDPAPAPGPAPSKPI